MFFKQSGSSDRKVSWGKMAKGHKTMDYNPILQKIKDTYIDILGSNLVGIYLHGSIAFGCFRWEQSDIDFIAVVSRPLALPVKTKLMEAIVVLNKFAPPKGIEMSVVLKKHCKNFVYPTPFELHFSNGQLGSYFADPQAYCKSTNSGDKDLAAHFTVIKSTGFLLHGSEIDAVFGNIPKAYYADSIKYDIEDAQKTITRYPQYTILNLC